MVYIDVKGDMPIVSLFSMNVDSFQEDIFSNHSTIFLHRHHKIIFDRFGVKQGDNI